VYKSDIFFITKKTSVTMPVFTKLYLRTLYTVVQQHSYCKVCQCCHFIPEICQYHSDWNGDKKISYRWQIAQGI